MRDLLFFLDVCDIRAKDCTAAMINILKDE